MAEMDLILQIKTKVDANTRAALNNLASFNQKAIKGTTDLRKGVAGTGTSYAELGKTGGAAMARVERGADKAAKSVHRVGRSGKFAFEVMQAFLFYRGFVFLQTQVMEFISELVNLEHELAIVQTQLNGLGGDARGEISTEIKKIAQETGISMSSLAKTEFEVVSANIALADSYQILSLSAKAAMAGGLADAELAFNSALTQVNAFKLTVDDFDEVFDKQFNLVKRGIFTYEQLATVIGDVSIAMAGMGQSIETSNAALAAISQVFTGKQLERGATGLRNAVIRMTSSFEDFEAAGIQIIDPETGEFRELLDIVEDLNAALDKMTESERAAAIKSLFPDIRQQKGISVLLGEVDNMRKFLVEQRFASGDLDEAATTVAATLKTQANILKAQFQPALESFVGGLGETVGALTDLNEQLFGLAHDFRDSILSVLPGKGQDLAKEALGVGPLSQAARIARFVSSGDFSRSNLLQTMFPKTFGGGTASSGALSIDEAQGALGAKIPFTNRTRADLESAKISSAIRSDADLEGIFQGAFLDIAKNLEEAIDLGKIGFGDIRGAIQTFVDEGAEAFLVKIGILDTAGGGDDATLNLAPFIEELQLSSTSLAGSLMEASELVRGGFLDGLGFTADSLEMFGEELQSLNKLVRQRAILEELQGIAEFADPGGDRSSFEGAMALLRDKMVEGGQGFFDILSDPNKLAELIAKMEFGDFTVDQSTQNNFVIRVSGDVSPAQIAALQAGLTDWQNTQTREASAR